MLKYSILIPDTFLIFVFTPYTLKFSEHFKSLIRNKRIESPRLNTQKGCRAKFSVCYIEKQTDPGPFFCECATGYSWDGSKCQATPVPTCADSPCGVDEVCADADTGRTCSCKTGFAREAGVCKDINECSVALDNCDVNAECTNTPGSFSCACKTGYSGDGTNCQGM